MIQVLRNSYFRIAIRAFFWTAMALATVSILRSIASAAENIETVKMDIAAQEALIVKLEEILPQLTDDKKKAITVTVRLGDLYSERARLKDMAAGESNCNECKDAQKDRDKAIAHYEAIHGKTDVETLRRVNLQLAHLHRLSGHTTQAVRIYNSILKNKGMVAIHGKAHLGLADIAFEQGNYKKAKPEYSLALNGANHDEQTYIYFRQAWTELNLGRTAASLKLMQKAVALAQKSNNLALQQDLMRDYATILARNPYTAADVDTFIRFSPEGDRAENLKFLGEESERLGNKRGSLLIWTQYNQQDKKADKEGAEIQLKLAQNYYDLEQPQKALEHLERVVVAVDDENCLDCDKVKADFRSLLITWNKKEKTSPSANLTAAYAKYLRMAPKDFEVMIWAGQVARQQNDLRAAYGFYEQAALLAYKNDRASDVDVTSTTAVEISEELKDSKLQQRALNNYLELNPKGTRRNVVLYQLADLSYQAKDFKRAAKEFQRLAMDNSWNDKVLRLQAADLSLDAYSKMGQEDELREVARDYSRAFPEKSSHFSEIARRVTVNRVVGLSKTSKTDESSIRAELERLKSFNLTTMSPKDRITHLKTQVIAAEKINDIGTIESASRELLKQPNLASNDREFAQKSLLWIYELRLDFKNAFALARQMSMSQLSDDQRTLRIGLLAELAGENPESYFRKYIKTSHTVRNANEIRIKLIRRARNQWKEFEKMYSSLRRTPDLLASITLELHVAKPNLKKVKQVIAVRGVYNTTEGQYMFNLIKREEFNKFAAEVHRAKINNKSDRALKRSIKDRVALLNRLNLRYTAAVRGGDLSLQMIVLNTISAENRRFHKQLNQLPAPKGLRKQERALYAKLLLEQSQPYAVAAKQADDRRTQFFEVNEKALLQLQKAVQSETLSIRQMAINEYRILKPYMPKGIKSDFEEVIAGLQINHKKVAEARREVESNPLDPSTLQDLRELEAKRANGPLLAYLDERIAQLKTETRR